MINIVLEFQPFEGGSLLDLEAIRERLRSDVPPPHAAWAEAPVRDLAENPEAQGKGVNILGKPDRGA